MQQRIPYDGNDLGAVYTKKYTAFRLWAPTADAVTLCLYREGDGDCLSDTLPMKRDVQGTWTIRVDGDLRHVYYTYRLERSGKTVESFGSCRCERAAEYGAGPKRNRSGEF